MANTDEDARQQLQQAFDEIESYYADRGIFQGRFGFGKRPAVVVVDFANGWTQEEYAGGTARLDQPVENTAKLLEIARTRNVPVIYTTSPWRPDSLEEAKKTAADLSPAFRSWDQYACQIDERVEPAPEDYIIEKESASAFHSTPLVGYLTYHRIDTVLITGCSTSACIRATATDAKAYRFQPIIVEDCVGDRVAVAHHFTLFDIQSRFADVVSLTDAIAYIDTLT